jgi:hypothetical protein
VTVNGPSPTAVSRTANGPETPAGTSTWRVPAGALPGPVVSEPNTWFTSIPGTTKPARRVRSDIVTSGSTGPAVEISSVLRFTAKGSVFAAALGAMVTFCPGCSRAATPLGPATSTLPARVQQTKAPALSCWAPMRPSCAVAL